MFIRPIVRDFVEAYIETVDELETLVFLQEHSNEEWSAFEVGSKLGLSECAAATTLATLKDAGVAAARMVGGEAVFRYRPPSPMLTRAIEELVMTHASFPKELTGLITGRSAAQVTTCGEFLQARRNKSQP